MRVSLGNVCQRLSLWRKEEPYKPAYFSFSRPKTWEAFYCRVRILLESPLAQQNKSRSLSLSVKLTVRPPLHKKHWLSRPSDLDCLKQLWVNKEKGISEFLQCSDMSSGPLSFLHCLFLLKVKKKSKTRSRVSGVGQGRKNSSKNSSGRNRTTYCVMGVMSTGRNSTLNSFLMSFMKAKNTSMSKNTVTRSNSGRACKTMSWRSNTIWQSVLHDMECVIVIV